MTDVMERTPPVGWYPDNPESTLLRWWDGSAWTDHTIDPAKDAAIQGEVDTLETAESATTGIEWFDDSAVPDEMKERIARSFANQANPDQAGLIMKNVPATEPVAGAWWNDLPATVPTRSSTEGIWALAFQPWVAALSTLGAVLVYSIIMPQIGFLVAGTLVPALWALATAVDDRKSLLRLGFQAPASAWWILLGPLAYMIARTIRVARVMDKGRAPLVLLLVNTVAVPAAVFAAIQFLPSIMGQF